MDTHLKSLKVWLAKFSPGKLLASLLILSSLKKWLDVLCFLPVHQALERPPSPWPLLKNLGQKFLSAQWSHQKSSLHKLKRPKS
jgi:hypothetical protein